MYKYINWYLYHVEKSDILLGYITEDNLLGYGLAVEIVYAKAKDKLIVLIVNPLLRIKVLKGDF